MNSFLKSIFLYLRLTSIRMFQLFGSSSLPLKNQGKSTKRLMNLFVGRGGKRGSYKATFPPIRLELDPFKLTFISNIIIFF